MTFPIAGWSAAMRRKAGTPAFAAACGALDARAAVYLDYLPPHPPHQAGYYHDFFCPEHAVALVFDPRGGTRHTCPADGASFQGEPFDSAWFWSVNDMLSDAALRLALRAFLRGGPGADAARAAEVLTGYARRYRNLPLGPKSNPDFPGVVTFTALDESVWVVRLAWAYAFLRGMLAPDDDDLIGRELLLPAAEHIQRVRWPEVHNVTCWNNAALVALGLVLGEERFVAAGVEGPLGLAGELAQGVRGDGLWWECSLSYHYYTLAALVWTVRSLEAGGRPFTGDATLRRMFSAPVLLAFPDLTLPAVNDCWYSIGLTGEVGHGIPDAAGFYETAYARYGDPEFAWVLERNYARRPRAGLEALLDGVERIEGTRAPRAGSCVLPDSGLAMLCAGPDALATSCLVLKAGPAAGVHGHPDQLAIQLYAAGARLVPDLGTAGYGIALNDGWYRQSASHSTVLIEGRSQPPASGRIALVESSSDFGLVRGSVSWDDGPYAAAEMRRTVFACESYFIDCFEVRLPDARAIDWVLAGRGRLEHDPAGASCAALEGECGYAALSSIREVETRDPLRLCWEVDGARLDVFLPAAPGERLYLALGPGNPVADALSLAIRRRRDRRALFLAVLAPYRSEAGGHVQAVRWVPGAAPNLEVQTARGVERWKIEADLSSARRTT
jgi:hypothetical protein